MRVESQQQAHLVQISTKNQTDVETQAKDQITQPSSRKAQEAANLSALFRIISRIIIVIHITHLTFLDLKIGQETRTVETAFQHEWLSLKCKQRLGRGVKASSGLATNNLNLMRIKNEASTTFTSRSQTAAVCGAASSLAQRSPCFPVMLRRIQGRNSELSCTRPGE